MTYIYAYVLGKDCNIDMHIFISIQKNKISHKKKMKMKNKISEIYIFVSAFLVVGTYIHNLNVFLNAREKEKKS